MISHSTALKYANELSDMAQILLKQHIEARVPINRRTETSQRRTLLAREFIAYTQKKGCASTPFPTHTRITELGRAVVCALLGAESDAISTNPSFIEDMAAVRSPPVAPRSPTRSTLAPRPYSPATLRHRKQPRKTNMDRIGFCER